MLVDFAHERWAAGRTVSPELWRCVGPYADTAAINDLEKTLDRGNTTEQQAAALALSSCPDERAATVLDTKPEFRTAIDSGDISWKKIAEALGD